MKLPCSVTRDLLPLYAEKLLEEETTALVDDHLAECPACRDRLAAMGEKQDAPIDTTKPLLSIRKELQKRRRWTAAIAALLVFVAVYTYFYHADSMRLIPWEEGLIDVAGVEKRLVPQGGDPDPGDQPVDALVIQVDSRINGMQEACVRDENGTTLLLEGWSSNPFSPTEPRTYAEHVNAPVPDRLIYVGEGQQKLLWGTPLQGGIAVLPRLALAYYVMVALAAAAVFGLLWFVLRKHQKGWIARQLFLVPCCYLIGHVLLKGMHTATFFIERDFISILLIASALYIAGSLAWQLWRRRETKA